MCFKKNELNSKQKKELIQVKIDLKIIGVILKSIFKTANTYEMAEQVIKEYFTKITNKMNPQKIVEYEMKYSVSKIFYSKTLKTEKYMFKNKTGVIIEYIKYKDTNEILIILNKIEQKFNKWFNSKIEIFAYDEMVLKRLERV